MAKTNIGTNTQFLGPQSGLSIVGEWAYAYSGVKSHDTNLQDYLNFTTGKEIIVCDVQILGDWDSIGANDIITNIYLNGQIVVQDDSSAELAPYAWPCKLVIPPLTHVKIEGKVSTGSGKEFVCVLTGRVYA